METQEETDYFTELNDDCIFEVFKRLPILDLGTVSQTCTKLKDLAGNYIIRKHPELIPKSLKICLEKNVFDFRRQESYIKCISQYVKQIEIEVRPENDSFDRFAQFIQANCGRDVNKIKFNGTKWTESFGEGIKDLLEKVTMVEFVECRDGFDNILTKCQNIQYLRICNWNILKKLPYNCYPTLETFEFVYLEFDTAPWNELTTFFQQNPNVKRFICTINLKTILTKRLLSILVENGNIDELYVYLFRMDGDFGLLYNELKILTDRTNFKRFELKLSCRSEESRTMNMLAPLQHFSGLHLSNWNRTPVNINQLIHLKILRLYECTLDETTAIAMAQCLQCLEQFHFRNNHFAIQVRECIKPFVRYSKNLTEMVIISSKVKDSHKDIPKLNAERRKLAEASKLIIFVNICEDWNEQLNVVVKDLVDVQKARIKDVSNELESGSPLN